MLDVVWVSDSCWVNLSLCTNWMLTFVSVCCWCSRDSSPSSDIADEAPLPNGHAVGSPGSASPSAGALRPPRPSRPQRPPASPHKPTSSTGRERYQRSHILNSHTTLLRFRGSFKLKFPTCSLHCFLASSAGSTPTHGSSAPSPETSPRVCVNGGTENQGSSSGSGSNQAPRTSPTPPRAPLISNGPLPPGYVVQLQWIF